MTSLILNLDWTDLKTRRKNSKLVSMSKILNELVEIPINDRLIPADRRTHGGHNHAYKHLRAHITLGQNYFWHRTIPDWNSLPAVAIESLWQRSRVSWLTKSTSLAPPPPYSLILHIGGAAGVPYSKSKSNNVLRYYIPIAPHLATHIHYPESVLHPKFRLVQKEKSLSRHIFSLKGNIY